MTDEEREASRAKLAAIVGKSMKMRDGGKTPSTDAKRAALSAAVAKFNSRRT